METVNEIDRPVTIRTDFPRDGKPAKRYSISVLELISYTKNISRLKNYYYILQKVVKENFVYCELCFLFMSNEVHHQNKNRKDNQLENLRMVCKWCHLKIHKTMYKHGSPHKRF